MKKNRISTLLIFILTVCLSQIVLAQETDNKSDTLRKGAVKIFLDCQSCDMNYTREQLTFVNFVRDEKEAQVYILVTQQNAGSV